MPVKQKVLIVGYGEMGHAFETILQSNHTVTIWNRTPMENQNNVSLESLVSEVDVIIFSLPVTALSHIIKQTTPFIPSATLCITIAKGLDDKGQTAAEIFQTNLTNYALIYGPMISEELCKKQMGFAQFYSHQSRAVDSLEKLFKDTNLLLQKTDDIVGISWSVILKNIYALSFGMIDELELGKNLYGFLMVTALNEIGSIIHYLGGNQNSSFGLAGLGDLITTASSEDSRHHALGRQIAQGNFKELNAEGIHTLLMIQNFNRFPANNYPFLTLIMKIIHQEIDITNGLKTLYT